MRPGSSLSQSTETGRARDPRANARARAKATRGSPTPSPPSATPPPDLRRAVDDLSRLLNDESRTLHLHSWRKPPATPQRALPARLQPHLRPHRPHIDHRRLDRPTRPGGNTKHDEPVFSVNYFCRLASTIFAGSGRRESRSTTMTPVGRVGVALRRPKRGGKRAASTLYGCTPARARFPCRWRGP